MSSVKHKVDQQPGVSIHREIPEMRSADAFDVGKVSVESRAAFKRVCTTGDATPEDYRHVLACVMGGSVIDEVLK